MRRPRTVALTAALLLPLALAGCRNEPTGAAPLGAEPLAPTVHQFHVAPTGSAAGDLAVAGSGTAAQPWTLAAALAQPAAVQPGDTIWVHGGTYHGRFLNRLAGSAARPVLVRALPGARATIDGQLVVLEGSDVWFWGLEITSTDPAPQNVEGVQLGAPRVRLINLVVHDNGGDGIGAWSQAPDAEIYGCIIYGNGRQVAEPGYAHGIYVQNDVGRKAISDNVIFGQYGFGIHAYAEKGVVRDIALTGNVVFANGVDGSQTDIFVGAMQPAQSVTVDSNMVFHGSDRTSVWLGYRYSNAPGSGIAAHDNYFIGGSPALRLESLTDLVLEGNFVTGYGAPGGIAAIVGATTQWSWARNHFLGDARVTEFGTASGDLTFDQWSSATGLGTRDTYDAAAPSTPIVIVRRNRYAPERALVVVYDWTGAPDVTVSPAGLLRLGDTYRVHDVRDLYGPALLSGSYLGEPLRLPLPRDALRSVSGALVPTPARAPHFAAFIIEGTLTP